MEQPFYEYYSGLGWNGFGRHLQSTAPSQLAEEHFAVALVSTQG